MLQSTQLQSRSTSTGLLDSSHPASIRGPARRGGRAVLRLFFGLQDLMLRRIAHLYAAVHRLRRDCWRTVQALAVSPSPGFVLTNFTEYLLFVCRGALHLLLSKALPVRGPPSSFITFRVLPRSSSFVRVLARACTNSATPKLSIQRLETLPFAPSARREPRLVSLASWLRWPGGRALGVSVRLETA